MARRLTVDELQAILEKVPGQIHDEVLRAMNTAVLLVEGQAKVNCGYTAEDGPAPASIPGSAYQPCPYDKPPHEEGHLCRANHGYVEEFNDGATIKGLVGNSQQEYNLHVHEGTSRMPGRPFLSDAVRQQQKNVQTIIGAGIKRGLEKAGQ